MYSKSIKQQFQFSSPEQLYLNLEQKRSDLIQRVPQQQLASYLGACLLTLSMLKLKTWVHKNHRLINKTVVSSHFYYF